MRLLLGLVASLLLVPPLLGGTLTEAERLQFADGLYARGMYEHAAKEYEAFLNDFPKSAKLDVVHYRLGESYRELGNVTAADKEFKAGDTECVLNVHRDETCFESVFDGRVDGVLFCPFESIIGSLLVGYLPDFTNLVRIEKGWDVQFLLWHKALLL